MVKTGKLDKAKQRDKIHEIGHPGNLRKALEWHWIIESLVPQNCVVRQ